ncbi:hypothetical protein EDB80DRAFT_874580 [Ilyonectria destructans]|nr:hypothetical protein EDB80DRAFT_874580 [Ilyonectria destructans]
MFNTRFETVSGRFSPSKLRNSFRRSSSRSSAARASIILRQPSLVGMEEERRNFGSELHVLEPRPIVYWGSVEERMGSLHF